MALLYDFKDKLMKFCDLFRWLILYLMCTEWIQEKSKLFWCAILIFMGFCEMVRGVLRYYALVLIWTWIFRVITLACQFLYVPGFVRPWAYSTVLAHWTWFLHHFKCKYSIICLFASCKIENGDKPDRTCGAYPIVSCLEWTSRKYSVHWKSIFKLDLPI